MKQIFIRPNSKRAKVTRYLLSSLLIIHLALSLRFFFLTQALKRNYSQEAIILHQEDLIMNIGGLVAFIIYILCIIYYIKWFRRAYYNLSQIASKLNYSNGWAAGAWFIPGFHWIGPIRMMHELYSKTNSYLIENKFSNSLKWSYLVMIIWWSLYVIAGASSIYNMLYFDSDISKSVDQLWKHDYYLIMNGVDFILTLTAIIVVWNYNKLEKVLSEIPAIQIDRKTSLNSEIIDDLNFKE